MKKYFSVRAELSRISKKRLKVFSLVCLKGSYKRGCQYIFCDVNRSHYMGQSIQKWTK